jgi:flavodoxin
MGCETNTKHEHENYCSACSTCHDCVEEGRERDNKRIQKLEEFNIGLANENDDLKQQIRNYRKARSM